MKKSLYSFSRDSYNIQESIIGHLHTDVLKSKNNNSKVILLIHGAAGCSIPFFPFMHLLSEYGYHIFAPNLPGHGKTPIEHSLDKLHLWDYIPYLKKLCDVIKPDIVIGHSMGSLLAQKLMEQYHFSAVILFSAIPPFGIKWKKNKTMRLITYGILHKIGYFFKKQLYVKNFEKHFIFSHTPEQQIMILSLATQKDKHPHKETKNLYKDLKNPQFTQVNTNKVPPILVCNGKNDPLMPAKLQKNIAKYFSAQCYLQPNSGHFFLIENGIESTTNYISRWLKEQITT